MLPPERPREVAPDHESHHLVGSGVCMPSDPCDTGLHVHRQGSMAETISLGTHGETESQDGLGSAQDVHLGSGRAGLEPRPPDPPLEAFC